MNRTVSTFLLLVLSLGLYSCQSDSPWMLRREDSHLPLASTLDNLDGSLPVMPPAIKLPDEDAVLYQDAAQRVNIKGQSAGLPDDLRMIYLTLFNAPPSLSTLQRDLDTILKLELQDYGLRMVKRISYAQAIINGDIKNFAISRADTVTTIQDALMYTLITKVQVQITKGAEPRFLEPRIISERLLVLGTNENTSNDVVSYMLELSSKHIAEAIIYGWQTYQPGQNEHDYQILGSSNESDSTTNRP